MGPVVGIVAAAQVDLALALIDGSPKAAGQLVMFDGRTDVLRRRSIARRPDCPLCGQVPEKARIERIDYERYVPPACAG